MVQMSDGIKIEMYWRRIEYIKDQRKLVFEIVPMMEEKAVICFPNESQWENISDFFSLEERLEIIFLFERINWKREVQIAILDIPISIVPENEEQIMTGSVEDTEAGRKIESSNLFDPNSELSKEEVNEVYLKLERKYCQSISGNVDVRNQARIPGSVFNEYILPILENNKNANIID